MVQTPHGDVAVFRTADDRVFALRDRCPHKGGPLSQFDGIVHGHRITCPLHNWVLELKAVRRSRQTWVAPRIIRCGWKRSALAGFEQCGQLVDRNPRSRLKEVKR